MTVVAPKGPRLTTGATVLGNVSMFRGTGVPFQGS